MYELVLYWINEVPDHFKTHKIYSEDLLENIPDYLKTQGICDKAFELWPWQLHQVLDHLKTQEIHNKAVRRGPWHLKYVPDWFMTEQQLNLW